MKRGVNGPLGYAKLYPGVKLRESPRPPALVTIAKWRFRMIVSTSTNRLMSPRVMGSASSSTAATPTSAPVSGSAVSGIGHEHIEEPGSGLSEVAVDLHVVHARIEL